MLIGLDEAIGVEILSYAKHNSHKLQPGQIEALNRYGKDRRILRLMSSTLYREYDEQKEGVAAGKSVYFHPWTRKTILAIVEKYEGSGSHEHN